MMLIGAENEIPLLGRKEPMSQLKMQINFWLAENLERNVYDHLFTVVRVWDCAMQVVKTVVQGIVFQWGK